MTPTKDLEKMHISHMEMPAIEKYLDDDIEFRNDLGKWAERNYKTIKQALTANTWRDINEKTPRNIDILL